MLGRFSRDGHDPHVAYRRIEASPVEIVPFGGEHAVLAAALVPKTQPLGLSLGDRACLALSIGRNCPVLTADRVWSELELPIDIMEAAHEPLDRTKAAQRVLRCSGVCRHRLADAASTGGSQFHGREVTATNFPSSITQRMLR